MKSSSLFITMVILFITSCKKDKVARTPLAAINVTNAVINGGNVKLNSNTPDSVKPYNAKVFGAKAGVNNILLFPSDNPAKPYYSEIKNLEEGSIYSIFLCGQAVVESVIAKDDIPEKYSDSVIGIRVINLSLNSGPLNVALTSTGNTNIFSNIGYKQLSDFVKFPLATNITVGSVTFEVRDLGNSAVLATYTLPNVANVNYPGVSTSLSRFKNITLVIKGLIGVTTGNNSFGIFPVANY